MYDINDYKCNMSYKNIVYGPHQDELCSTKLSSLQS